MYSTKNPNLTLNRKFFVKSMNNYQIRLKTDFTKKKGICVVFTNFFLLNFSDEF